MNDNNSYSNTVSLRKTYVARRAQLIRQSLESHRENIQTFVEQVASHDFNPTKDEMLFAKTLGWMEQNLHQECKINDVAKILAVSVRKIQRLFSFFADRSYTQLLLELRMSAAKKYLAEFKNSIGQVGYLVGIPDHAYFTYLFRKSVGLTPSDYRLSLMQNQSDLTAEAGEE